MWSQCVEIAALITLPLLVGCGGYDGPQRAAVRGHVTLDGQPLPAGIIRFIPTGGTQGPAATAVISAGDYELPEAEGPIVGSHRVEIEATDYYGFAIDDEAAYLVNIEARKRGMPRNPIPEIYNRHSTLTAEVTNESSQQFDFSLTTSGQHTAQR